MTFRCEAQHTRNSVRLRWSEDKDALDDNRLGCRHKSAVCCAARAGDNERVLRRFQRKSQTMRFAWQASLMQLRRWSSKSVKGPSRQGSSLARRRKDQPRQTQADWQQRRGPRSHGQSRRSATVPTFLSILDRGFGSLTHQDRRKNCFAQPLAHELDPMVQTLSGLRSVTGRDFSKFVRPATQRRDRKIRSLLGRLRLQSHMSLARFDERLRVFLSREPTPEPVMFGPLELYARYIKCIATLLGPKTSVDSPPVPCCC